MVCLVNLPTSTCCIIVDDVLLIYTSVLNFATMISVFVTCGSIQIQALMLRDYSAYCVQNCRDAVAVTCEFCQ